MQAIREISDEERKTLSAISLAAFMAMADECDFDLHRYDGVDIDYSDPMFHAYLKKQNEIVKKTSRHLKACQIAGVMVDGMDWTILSSRPVVLNGMHGQSLELLQKHLREYTCNEFLNLHVKEVYDAVYDALADQERLFYGTDLAEQYMGQ